MEMMARLGYGARGLVYCQVGVFALLAAIGRGGDTGGSRNALGQLLEQPFGSVLVGILALGLACFAAWRIVEAATDADGHGSKPKGRAVRAAHGLSGIIYAGLALTAAGMAIGRRSGGGDEDRSARDWTEWLFAQPLGRWLVAAIALAIIAAGAGFAWKAYRGNVTDRLDMPPGQQDWIVFLGRAGYGARGVVFGLIGAFLLGAAWHSRSAEVKGLGGALRALEDQPYGWILLAATALGLACFGMFGLVQARFRRVQAPSAHDVPGAAAAARVSRRW
jgi:hypothetical protein